MLQNFKGALIKQSHRRARHNGRRRSLALESLETRCVLSAAGLDLAALVSDPQSFAADRVLVRLRDDANLPAGLAGSPLMRSLNMWSVGLGPGNSVAQQIAALRALPEVLYAQPDYKVSIQGHETDSPWDDGVNDMLYLCGMLWGLNNDGTYEGTVDADIDAPTAWHTNMGSADVVVAVIDTGVDYTHPDLQANMWTNTGETPGNSVDDDGNGYIDDVHGYDFHNNDSNPMDDHSHGTHVAGTIAAVGNNNPGADCGNSQGKGIIGVAPNAKIMALKFLDASGSGYDSNAIRALDYAIAAGSRVSNNSYGGSPYDQAMADAIQRAANADHLFVAAAGNGDWLGRARNNDSTAHYPSGYQPTPDTVLAVAATTSSDGYASFSNYGATSVDLAAPGVHVWSTIPYAKDTADGNNDGYGRKDGTSMATPHVAGAAAFVLAANPSLSALEVKQLLMSTVDPITGRDTVSDGRLNVGKAMGAMDTKPSVQITQPADGALVSGVVTISATASDDQGIKHVDFFLNGSFIARDTDGSDGWNASWDSSGASDGTYAITATATDTIDQINSDDVSVRIDNFDDAPTIIITHPVASSFVSGAVTVTASATDDRGVRQVEFNVNGAVIGVDENGADGWSVIWNPVADGTYTITATATDTGEQSTYHTVSDVRVDTTGPTVSISEPSAGAAISGVTTLTALATDDNGVQQVAFMVDGVVIGTDISGTDGWSFNWDSSTVANGSHAITARATDVAGNDASSAAVSVTTSNTVLIAQDGFESGNYTGGTGWKAGWTRSGDAYVRSDGYPVEGNYHARLRRSNGYLSRPADLSGWTDVQLTFWAQVNSFEGSDKAWVKVSPDGSTWTTISTLSTSTAAGYYQYQLSVPASHLTSQFRVAFDAGMNSTGDQWYVDLVQLTGQKTSGTSSLAQGSAPLDLELSAPSRQGTIIVSKSGSLSVSSTFAPLAATPTPAPLPNAVDRVLERVEASRLRQWATLEDVLDDLLGE